VRFLLAIVSFIVAAALIGFGIAQRTVFAPPDALSTEVTTEGDAAFTLLSGETLTANSGNQDISISGDGAVFAAYGRTSDVVAWLGDEPYNAIAFDEETRGLSSSVVEPDEATDEADTGSEPSDEGAGAGGTEEGAVPEAEEPAAAAPNPAGSDLWLEEYTGEGELDFTVRLPEDVSVLVASDGAAPAPADIGITWPLDQRTPLAGPLIVGGLFFLLLGIGFYLWALSHLRRSRRPRRKQPRMPKVPRQRSYGPRRGSIPFARRSGAGRRSLVAAPVVVGALLLSGCTADFWPDVSAGMPTASPSASAEADGTTVEEDQPPAAVTEQQLEGIVAEISETVTQADNERNVELLRTRMDGSALQLRETNYAVRGADEGAAPAPQPIPASPVALTLPQQTDSWPRTVFTVLQDAANPETAAIALMLVQDSPREQYKVDYQITLEPSAELPPVAPASIGAARLTVDNRLLSTAPNEVGPAYADVLLNGGNSQFNALFATEGDTLRTQVGAEAKQTRRDELPDTAEIEFQAAVSDVPPIALATNDAGALVAVTVNETEIVRPVEEGASVNASGAVSALINIDGSTRGITATYGEQLLFYVPSTVNEGEQIRLLGYSQGLVSAAEVSE
jgi:hypothetical protein